MFNYVRKQIKRANSVLVLQFSLNRKSKSNRVEIDRINISVQVQKHFIKQLV